MESRNIVLAVLIVAIALGVFYMIDPTFGGLLKKARNEGFADGNNAMNMNMENPNFNAALAPNGSFNSGNYVNGANDAENVMANENADRNNMGNSNSPMTPPAPNNAGANATEGFENLAPSPMPFPAAEKPANCFPKAQLGAADLLPNDPNSKWAQVNPQGAGDISGKNFLNAGALIGVNTVGSSLRNASWDLRSEPPNPQVRVSPWMQSSIEPDVLRRPLEIG